MIYCYESYYLGDRNVAKALVADPRTWTTSMRHCVPEDGKQGGRLITPMRMLIESMPGSFIAITVCMPNEFMLICRCKKHYSFLLLPPSHCTCYSHYDMFLITTTYFPNGALRNALLYLQLCQRWFLQSALNLPHLTVPK